MSLYQLLLKFVFIIKPRTWDKASILNKAKKEKKQPGDLGAGTNFTAKIFSGEDISERAGWQVVVFAHYCLYRASGFLIN